LRERYANVLFCFFFPGLFSKVTLPPPLFQSLFHPSRPPPPQIGINKYVLESKFLSSSSMVCGPSLPSFPPYHGPKIPSKVVSRNWTSSSVLPSSLSNSSSSQKCYLLSVSPSGSGATPHGILLPPLFRYLPRMPSLVLILVKETLFSCLVTASESPSPCYG